MAHKFCQSCGNEVIKTMRVCPQCGSKVFSNEPVTTGSPAQSPNTLGTSNPPIKSSAVNPGITPKADSLVGYTSLTKWITWSLYLQIIVTVIAIISSFLEYQLLTDLKDGIYASVDQAVVAAEASDTRQKIIGYIALTIYLVSGVLMLKWIYQASKNVRIFGATSMAFTPGWSIGCYFMPFTNLWKPYQAMKEIWKASVDPKDWKDLPNPPILRWWWFFWLISGLSSNVAFRMILKAKQVGDYIVSNVFSLIGDIAYIPLILITLAIVNKIYELQMSHFNKRI